MRDPTADQASEEARVEDAIKQACRTLSWLKKRSDITVKCIDRDILVVLGRGGMAETETPEAELRDAVEFCTEILNSAAVYSFLREDNSFLGDDPATIRDYIDTFVIPVLQAARPGHRKPGSPPKIQRDALIVSVIGGLCQRYDLSPARNRENKDHESACSIVTKALKRLDINDLGEQAIEKIWTKSQRHRPK